MGKKIDEVLKEVLENIRPSKGSLEEIEFCLKDFLEKFEKKLKSLKIDAEVFIGGSYAKKTMIRKEKYDIDIFVRHRKNLGDISALTEKVLKEFKFKKVHGSRDYFQINITPNLFFEIIPVKKVNNPKESENITDLSYSHVKYIRKKIKTEKLLDEIRLAKAFCYANKCYGAESYINGFSGYALELLVYNYKSFLKFIGEMSKAKEKVVIDIEKLHKKKQMILMDLNSSKLISPVILIDPTYKQRNAAAALSEETFKKFQKICDAFLKNPSAKAFELKKINFEKLAENTGKRKRDFVLLEAQTNRQTGDIAGSKLLKFYRYLEEELKKFFRITQKEFEYNGEENAKYFFAVKSKKELLISGPQISDKKNAARFKKKHRKTFVKKNRIYAKEKIDFNAREFVKKWKPDNSRIIKEMGISGLEVK